MREKPRLFDDLGLVALPTAVSCARMFAEYTLARWGASTFVVADALVVAQELVTLSVQDTGVADDTIRWSELDHLNRIVVRLLGFARHVVIEVWDTAPEPVALPDDGLGKLPAGLHLVDVTATKWGSVASPQGRLTWAEIAVYDRTDSGLPIRQRKPRPHPVMPAPSVDEEVLRRVQEGLNVGFGVYRTFHAIVQMQPALFCVTGLRVQSLMLPRGLGRRIQYRCAKSQ